MTKIVDHTKPPKVLHKGGSSQEAAERKERITGTRHEPMFPVTGYYSFLFSGLTKREYFIGQAMMGLSDFEQSDDFTQTAIAMADKICDQLYLEAEKKKR